MHLILTLAHSRWLWFVLLLCASTYSLHAKDVAPAGIAPEKVADFVHAVLDADRTIYTDQVVNRMQAKGSYLPWNIGNMKMRCAPRTVPATFRQTRRGVRTRVRYRLISLWPIYQRNALPPSWSGKALEKLFTDPRPAVHRDRDKRPQTVLSSHLFRPSGFSGLRQSVTITTR